MTIFEGTDLMKLIRMAAAVIGLVLASTTIAGCASSKKQQFSEKETKYYIAYSHVMNKGGEFCVGLMRTGISHQEAK